MSRLFVYGTLKRGDCRAHFLDGQRFIGEATVEGFRLVDCGAYPGLVPGEGVVRGEAYDVDSAIWPTLDAVEGVDVGLYRRQIVRLCDGSEAQTYVYRGDAAGLPDLGGVWTPRS